MSTINTSGIDVNYPIPGQNNGTQGFRNNFASIKQNLNTAASEISDLQTKAVLKTALANTTIDNNMGNTLIANASTLQFRATMYNLGNAIVDSVRIDCILGDVQYGMLAGNVDLTFGSWIPTNTWGGVELHLSRPNTEVNYGIYWPSEAVFDSNHGFDLIENAEYYNNQLVITFPHNVTTLHFKLNSDDCGNTIYIQPLNRPFRATQLQAHTPPSTGQLGDKNGTVYVDANVAPLTITASTSADFLVTTNTSTLYTGMPVNFTGTSFETSIVPGATYYVGNIANTTHFTISGNANAVGNVNLIGGAGNLTLNPVSYMYIATATYSANAVNRNIDSISAPNIITVSGSTANLAVNNPIIFTGLASGNTGNITVDKVYYIYSVNGSNITISPTLNNGVVGPEVNTLTTVNYPDVDIDYTVYDGPDIFRKIPLTWGTTTVSSADIPSVSNIRIGGGQSGYYLQTDGSGNLAWVAGGGSGNGVVAGSSTQIQFNNGGSFGAAVGFTFNSGNGLMNVPGAVIASGNVQGNNFTVAGNITVAGNATLGNLSIPGSLNLANVNASGQVNVTGNVFGGNLVTNGTLVVTDTGILGNLIVDINATMANVFAADLIVANDANVTGNIIGANSANITGNIHSGANVSANGYMLFSSKDGISATGTDQAGAVGIDCSITVVSTTPASSGVRLPDAPTGARLIIRNSGGNSLNVYPASGDQINSLGVNSPYSLSTNTGIEFYCANAAANQWYTL